MTQSFHSNPRTNSDALRDDDFNPDADPGYDDARVAQERDAERERAEARNAARERAEQARRDDEPRTPANATGAGSTLGTSYLGDHTTEESWEQWRKIQADFVDNPRDAVSNAHSLVGGVIDNIVRQFETERSQMEQRWSAGQDVSTEDLRKCLQTYRDFFGRLLAKVDVKN
jgi:hypothetical protein